MCFSFLSLECPFGRGASWMAMPDRAGGRPFSECPLTSLSHYTRGLTEHLFPLYFPIYLKKRKQRTRVKVGPLTQKSHIKQGQHCPAELCQDTRVFVLHVLKHHRDPAE